MSSNDKLTVAPTAPTRLRQIALIAEDIDRARYLLVCIVWASSLLINQLIPLQTTILGTEVVYVDPQVAQWGIQNILGKSLLSRGSHHLEDSHFFVQVAIGGDIIEVCSPIKPNTTVGRLLQKRGDGGYMIIMQTSDAAARRKYIETNNLSKVIWSHSHDDVDCVQYHPKGIAGGMMPELDSHRPSPQNPTPLESPFSPWHACGSDFDRYSAAMRRCSHLKLVGATCRLAPSRPKKTDVEQAAQQWQDYFGVEREGNDRLKFTNARLTFVPGVEGLPEGLESITIAVKGKNRLDKLLEVVSREGLCGDGWTNLLGLRWYFVLQEEDAEKEQERSSNRSKL